MTTDAPALEPTSADPTPSLPADSRWLISQRFDVGMLALPMIAALASLLTLRAAWQDALPLWAFLFVIVAFDVTHVWATIYLTYFDREVMQKRWLLLSLTPFIAFVVSYRIHDHSPSLFWTLLAYVAIYHFVQQQWGFIALYKSRAREKNRLDYYLDRWTLWVGALGPVLLWHASPKRQFDWFNAGESFIFRLDAAFRDEITLVMGVFAGAWVLRQAYVLLSGGRLNAGKTLWMVCSWVSWVVGIRLSNHPFVSAAFLNLFHGPQFLALVWYRAKHRFVQHPEVASRWVGSLFSSGRWIAFYVLLFAVAIAEETLWDGIVWRVYLPELLALEPQRVQGGALSLWVALLSVPQITHYYLDAWIWKLDGSNPDLLGFLRARH